MGYICTAYRRFLSTGDSFRTIADSYRIGRSTVANIVHEACTAIWNVLKNDYMNASETTLDWRNIAEKFEGRWNFPNCIGTIDGKHVQIQCPPGSGSMFYNYKGTYSVVLMAVVDAE